MAWWSAGIFNRYAVRHHGRTAHEYATGHKTKLPVACFGETVLWRQRRNNSELGNHGSEYSEGIFLGIGGMSTELLVGTPKGVFRTRDVRALSDTPAKWNREFVLKFNTPFENYVDPSEQLPDQVIIEPGVIAHGELPPDVETHGGATYEAVARGLHSPRLHCRMCRVHRLAPQNRTEQEPL